jgi:hypothetical protein
MGNGFTFPLQTIIFSAILKACATIFGRYGQERTWSCFGDDLICHKVIFDRVSHYLGKLGFSLNADKSFSEGPFRESCGADWFYGQPVRPVFIRKLDSPHDILVAINALNEWSAYTGVSLSNTITYLLSNLDQKYLIPVPFDSGMDSGIRVPSAMCNKRSKMNSGYTYKAWSRRPSRLLILHGKIRFPGALREVPYNPYGLYCSFLWGELVAVSKGTLASPFSKLEADYIMVRHDRKVYQLKPRYNPSWDYIPTVSLTNGVRLTWQQWETAVLFNMYEFKNRTGSIRYRY